MPLVNMNQMLADASEKGYGVGAFNVANLESITAVIDAAEKENTPVIVQVFRRLFDEGAAEYIALLTREMAGKASIPVALHLDHGNTTAQTVQAMRYGFTSVMIDSSQLPFEDNVALARGVVETAHAVGISVEAELGHVPAKDNTEKMNLLTVPEEAKEFVEKTGVDALAVAIGTAHGFYKEKPVLDFERLEQIRDLVDVPLVLHGGSDVPDHDLQKAIQSGVSKINVATDLQMVFINETSKFLKTNPDKFYPIDVFLKPVVKAMTEFVRDKLRLFKTSSQVN